MSEQHDGSHPESLGRAESQKAVARLPKGLQLSSLAAKSYAEHTEHQIVAAKHTNL